MSLWNAAVLVAAQIISGQATPPPPQANPAPSRAVTVDGQVVLLADTLPRKDAAELRPSAPY